MNSHLISQLNSLLLRAIDTFFNFFFASMVGLAGPNGTDFELFASTAKKSRESATSRLISQLSGSLQRAMEVLNCL